MDDAQRALEDEKTKSNVWMTIAIIAMVVGVILLGIVGYMTFARRSPQCPECIISPEDALAATHAAGVVDKYNTLASKLGVKTTQKSCTAGDE